MALVGIHHVQLAMPPGEEERAVEFYQGLLGVPEVPKPEPLAERGGCWFESGPVRIHLGVEAEFRPARRAHPALLVDDLDSLRQTLDDAGVEVMVDGLLPGFERFYATDPFGNRLELLRRSD